MSIATAYQDSPVTDEFEHIGAGWWYLNERSYELNVYHPPLMKLLSAVLLKDDLAVPINPINASELGVSLIEAGADPRSQILKARLPLILLNTALSAALIFFLWTIFGNFIAGAFAVLFCFHPLILAHARLVTTDVAVMLFIALGILSLVRLKSQPSLLCCVGLGLILGFGLLSKYSAALVIPFGGFYLMSWSSMGTKYVARRLAYYVFALLIAALLINGVYLLLMQDESRYILPAIQGRLIGSRNHWIPQGVYELVVHLHAYPLTEGIGRYLVGALLQFNNYTGAPTDVKLSFFAGTLYTGGHPLFFPVLWFLKEPIGALILLTSTPIAFGIARGGLLGNSEEQGYALCLLLFAGLFCGVAMIAQLNVGVRHLLPIYPALLIVSCLSARVWWRGIRGRMFVALCCLLCVAEAMWAFPHFISHYNVIGGGKHHGDRWGLDSNFDWGQDLGRIAEAIDRLPQKPIYVAVWGRGNLRAYTKRPVTIFDLGSDNPPQEGIIIVGITNLELARQHFPAQSEWIRKLVPSGRIGSTTLIYEVARES